MATVINTANSDNAAGGRRSWFWRRSTRRSNNVGLEDLSKTGDNNNNDKKNKKQHAPSISSAKSGTTITVTPATPKSGTDTPAPTTRKPYVPRYAERDMALSVPVAERPGLGARQHSRQHASACSDIGFASPSGSTSRTPSLYSPSGSSSRSPSRSGADTAASSLPRSLSACSVPTLASSSAMSAAAAHAPLPPRTRAPNKYTYIAAPAAHHRSGASTPGSIASRHSSLHEGAEGDGDGGALPPTANPSSAYYWRGFAGRGLAGVPQEGAQRSRQGSVSSAHSATAAAGGSPTGSSLHLDGLDAALRAASIRSSTSVTSTGGGGLPGMPAKWNNMPGYNYTPARTVRVGERGGGSGAASPSVGTNRAHRPAYFSHHTIPDLRSTMDKGKGRAMYGSPSARSSGSELRLVAPSRLRQNFVPAEEDEDEAPQDGEVARVVEEEAAEEDDLVVRTATLTQASSEAAEVERKKRQQQQRDEEEARAAAAARAEKKKQQEQEAQAAMRAAAVARAEKKMKQQQEEQEAQAAIRAAAAARAEQKRKQQQQQEEQQAKAAMKAAADAKAEKERKQAQASTKETLATTQGSTTTSEAPPAIPARSPARGGSVSSIAPVTSITAMPQAPAAAAAKFSSSSSMLPPILPPISPTFTTFPESAYLGRSSWVLPSNSNSSSAASFNESTTSASLTEDGGARSKRSVSSTVSSSGSTAPTEPDDFAAANITGDGKFMEHPHQVRRPSAVAVWGI